MLSFNAVEVAVMVDGAELTRYGVQCDNLNNTVTCWIPSEAGKVRSNYLYCASLTRYTIRFSLSVFCGPVAQAARRIHAPAFGSMVD